MVAESPGRFVLRFLIELGQLLDLRARPRGTGP